MLKNSFRNGRQNIVSVGRSGMARSVGLSLLKRRIWFADDDTDGDGQGEPKYDPKDLEEAKKIIDSLVKRVDERDATITSLKQGQERFEERITAMEKAARKRSEDDGDYKKLYDDLLAEHEQLKPVAERGKSAIEQIRLSNEARIEKIPEQFRKAIPVDYPPEKLQTYLNENEGWMTRQPAPDYEGGKGGNGEPPNPKLTPEEIHDGKLLGLSEEDLLKAKGEES